MSTIFVPMVVLDRCVGKRCLSTRRLRGRGDPLSSGTHGGTRDAVLPAEHRGSVFETLQVGQLTPRLSTPTKLSCSWIEAENACSKALSQHRSIKGYYRRAKARRMMERTEEAIKGKHVC